MTTDRASVVFMQLKFPLPRFDMILFGVHGFCFDFSSRWAVGRAPCGMDLVCSPLDMSIMALGWEMGLVQLWPCRLGGLDLEAERHEPEGRGLPYLAQRR